MRNVIDMFCGFRQARQKPGCTPEKPVARRFSGRGAVPDHAGRKPGGGVGDRAEAQPHIAAKHSRGGWVRLAESLFFRAMSFAYARWVWERRPWRTAFREEAALLSCVLIAISFWGSGDGFLGGMAAGY